jgi:hypothetical protein
MSTMMLRLLVLIVPLLVLMVLTRPLASEWPGVVARLRRKDKAGYGSFSQAMEPVREAWNDVDERWDRLYALAAERYGVCTQRWDDQQLWATDASLFTVACTKKKCFVGALGVWRAVPGPEIDLWALLGANGVACAVCYAYDVRTFYQIFSPRFSEPHTLLTSMFATSSPFELLWMYGTILGLGRSLQRALGRGGFLALYLSGGISATLIALFQRHSSTGAGGVLATLTYHTLLAPHSRHSVFGIEMGAKMALAVQVGFCCWPALSGQAARPGVLLAMNGMPTFLAAALFFAREA